MIIHLTDVVVRKLPLPERGSKVHFDTGTKGFGACITAAGTRSFVLNYRVRGTGRERRIVIGRYPTWSTVAAREEAKRLRRLIDDGGDPLASIEAEREAPTVADLIDRFMAEHVEPRLRPSTVRNYQQMIRRHIRPHFGIHTKVADVDFEDIDALHRKVSKDAPYSANRTAQLLSKMFALAVRWKMRSDNPAKGVEHNYEQKRKRYMTGDELARLTAALAAFSNQQSANVIRLLLLTGCRRFEAMSARWDAIDLTSGIWTKLGSSTKQKSDHTVPLSAPARQLLSEIFEQQPAQCPWVFPSDKGETGHVVELATAWEAICKAAGIKGLRIHDLRHSFASQLASGGASLPLIGALLGHSNPATTARYAHLFQDPQRAAVERVGAVIGAAGKPAVEPTKVKALRRGFPTTGGTP
jgi:integrase